MWRNVPHAYKVRCADVINLTCVVVVAPGNV